MNTYLSSSIIFHNDKITTKLQKTFGDMEIPVMMDWEDSLMSASAAYVTQNGGDNNNTTVYTQYGISYLDSPSTTSSTTYTLSIKRGSGSTNLVGTDGTNYMITAMEVAA